MEYSFDKSLCVAKNTESLYQTISRFALKTRMNYDYPSTRSYTLTENIIAGQETNAETERDKLRSNNSCLLKRKTLNNLYKPLQNYETKKFLSDLRPLFATLRQTYNTLITNHLYTTTPYSFVSTRSSWPFYRVKAALLPCQSYALIVQKHSF